MAHSLKLCILLFICIAHCQARRRAKSVHTVDLDQPSKLELLKETSNNIGHGPEYVSHHKELKYNHKGSSKHRWGAKKKGGFTKKSKLGQHGSQKPANTRYDHDNINLQRLDYQPITQKKKMPKTFNQMMKKKSQKPNKKMDKMYKKMMEKERLRLKKEHYKKMQKKYVP
eukprot:TRINITY_DN1687_c0_g1_i1.p1 TRINITY_DN1687_c0_g1~~TRINITY_DN1687_c0_g1_i1.p1  ORF type:complete len:170 (-),score=49.55 TRINITY_DN1687_c0_g1_i1:129-638(-)